MSPRNWSIARQKVRREGECRWCGVRQGLDPAHVIPRSIGGGMDEDDVVPLCRSCHRAFDAHQLDLLSALSYLEQAAAVRLVGLERARERLLPSEYQRGLTPWERNMAAQEEG